MVECLPEKMMHETAYLGDHLRQLTHSHGAQAFTVGTQYTRYRRKYITFPEKNFLYKILDFYRVINVVRIPLGSIVPKNNKCFLSLQNAWQIPPFVIESIRPGHLLFFSRFALPSLLILIPWIAIALLLILQIFRFAHRSIALKKTSGLL